MERIREYFEGASVVGVLVSLTALWFAAPMDSGFLATVGVVGLPLSILLGIISE